MISADLLKFSLKPQSLLTPAAWLLPPLAALLLVLIFVRATSIELFPLSGRATCALFDDRDESGNSDMLLVDSAKMRISLQFCLREGVEYPYAGINFLPKQGRTFDVRRCNYLEIVTEGALIAPVSAYINSLVPGFSRPDEALSSRYTTAMLQPAVGSHRYRVDFSQFSTPVWWYDVNHLAPGAIPENPDLSAVTMLSIQTNELTPLGVSHAIALRSVALKADTGPLLWILALLLAFWYGWLLLRLNRQNLRKRFATPMPYTPLALGNYADEQTARIVEYLGAHFCEAELSIGVVARQTGVAADKVSGLLETYCRLPFKQYVISLRLAEAKRLLRETDRQVTEIALSLGFNWPTTFNRLFREREGMSPTDYRKKG